MSKPALSILSLNDPPNEVRPAPEGSSATPSATAANGASAEHTDSATHELNGSHASNGAAASNGAGVSEGPRYGSVLSGSAPTDGGDSKNRDPGEPELPYREIGGWPSTRGFVLSVLLHVALIAGLANFHFRLPEKPPPQADLSPTEIRLSGKLYYVNSISGNEGSKKSAKVVAPLARAAGKSSSPKPDGGRAGQSSSRIASLFPAAPVPAAAPAAPKPEPAQTEAANSQTIPAANQRQLARTFVPPEIKRSPNATQTLIQPISPPDVVPPPTPLPSFRVMTPAIPTLPKPFAAPGRKVPQPPAQVAQVQPLELDLIHADPAPSITEPKLALPRTPPPPDQPKTKLPDGPTPAPQGDPLNILSLSNRPVPPTDKVIVPQGNIAQESGEAAASANGAGKNSSAAGSAAGANGSGRNPNANGTAANGQGAGTEIAEGHIPGAGGNGEAGPGNGTGGAPGNGPGIGNAGAGTGAGVPGTGVSGNGTGNNGNGRSTVGNGTGSALTGGGNSGSATAIVGGPGGSPNGTGTGTGTGAGAGSGPGQTRPGQIIERSPSGNFDTVVVQTSPLDQYPESRGLLTGRPIYSVYVTVGSARDWTLYFCVPNEKPPANDSPVVQLGPPATPVKAPYPFKMQRPTVTLPTWEKYVLIHGYVNAEGHFESLRIVRSILPDIDKSLLATLSGWEFRAATRDGSPIMVEFLLSIPAKGL